MKSAVPVEDLLVQIERLFVVAFFLRDRRTNQCAPERTGIAANGVPEVIARLAQVTVTPRPFGKLAIVVGDMAGLLAAARLEATLGVDRLLPLLLALVDIDESLECGRCNGIAVRQIREQAFGAIKKTGAEIVLAERVKSLVALCLTQIRSREKILVDPDRPFHLPTPSEQMTEREVRLERLVVDLGHLEEKFERFVGTPVENEVEPPDIVGVDACRKLAVAVPVSEPREGPAGGREDDEQTRQQECGFSRHLAAASPAGC